MNTKLYFIKHIALVALFAMGLVLAADWHSRGSKRT
jgi:hypothetical protein